MYFPEVLSREFRMLCGLGLSQWINDGILDNILWVLSLEAELHDFTGCYYRPDPLAQHCLNNNE